MIYWYTTKKVLGDVIVNQLDHVQHSIILVQCKGIGLLLPPHWDRKGCCSFLWYHSPSAKKRSLHREAYAIAEQLVYAFRDTNFSINSWTFCIEKHMRWQVTICRHLSSKWTIWIFPSFWTYGKHFKMCIRQSLITTTLFSYLISLLKPFQLHSIHNW